MQYAAGSKEYAAEKANPQLPADFCLLPTIQTGDI